MKLFSYKELKNARYFWLFFFLRTKGNAYNLINFINKKKKLKFKLKVFSKLTKIKKFRCDEGFISNGTNILNCHSDGLWKTNDDVSTLPLCIRTNCERIYMNDHLFYDITYIPGDSESILESKKLRELLVMIKSYIYTVFILKIIFKI